MFYENYLNSIKPDISFIPEAASEIDASIFTERSIQDAFNEAFIGIAMNEMATFEKAINEGEEAEAVKDSPEQKKQKLAGIKKFFSTIWAKIKGFFVKLTQNIKAIFTKFKVEKGKLIEKDFKDAVNKINSGTEKKDKLNFALYGKDAIDGLNDYKKDFDEISKCATSWSEAVIKGQEYDSYTKNDLIDKCANYEALSKIKTKNNATFADVISMKEQIIKIVFQDNGILDSIKKAYDATKTEIDRLMKSAQDAVNKGKDAKKIMKISTAFGSAATSLEGKYCAEYKKIRYNYVGVVGKVIAKSKRKAYVGESVYVEDEIEEAFSFLEGKDEVDDVNDTEDYDSDAEDTVDVEKEAALAEAIIAYLS